MELTPGYKQTEVGLVPDSWKVASLAAVSDRIMVGIASAATHAYRANGVPLLRNQNIKAGFLDDRDLLHVERAYEETFRNKRLRAGDLLTARTGYPGLTCVVPLAYEAAQCFTTLITRPKRDVVDSSFLCQFINSQIGQSFFERSQIGGAQKNVNAGTLRGMPIPVPPLTEQKAIAAALSDVDALLGALDQLIAKKRDLKQAAMQQLLNGQTRLPGFSGKWETKRLGELAEVVMGQSPSSVSYNTKGVGLPLIQGNADVSKRKTIRRVFTTEVTKFGRPGDVLLSVRAPVGEVARATFDVCLGRGVCAVRTQTDFLFHYLISRESSWSRLSKGSTFDSVTSADVRQFEVFVPADAKEQDAIATVLSDLDAELSALEQRRDKTRLLKQGMMHELLTGRTRLL